MTRTNGSTRGIPVFLMTALLLLSGCRGKTESGNSAAAAPQYPTKPITLLCGYAAGGSSDLQCRILAEALTKELGQPVTVIDKAGGGGFVAWNEFVKSTATDGYTFSLINTPNLVAGKYDKANPREFDYTAMDILANQVSDYNVIACRPNETRFTDFKSMIEFSKKTELLFGSGAVGIMSDDDTIAQRLNQEVGTKIKAVVTTGAKDNETYLMNKSTDLLIGNVADVLTGRKNGELKVLAVFAPQRVSLIDDVPTCEELGFGAIYGSSSRGYALPKGVDPSIRNILFSALERAIKSSECITALEGMGASTNYIAGEDYAKFLDNEREIAKKTYGISN